MYITLDFESRSEADLKKVGAWKYWQHPSTKPLILTVTWDGGQIVWREGEPIPPQLEQFCYDPSVTFDSHNTSFEQAAWAWCARNLDWPELPPNRWDDTQARAAALSLPLQLERVGKVLDLAVKKDPIGKKWLTDFTRPRKPTKKDPTIWRPMSEEDWQTGVRYCLSDSHAEHLLRKKMGSLSARERNVWLMDQAINQRGVRVDLGQVRAAREIVSQIEEKLTRELKDRTKGEIESHNQVAVTLDWLAKRGVWLDDLTADSVEEALASRRYSDENTKRVLEIRKALAKASTKKLDAFERAACNDGRVHYMFQYHGANTGRWAGRLINLQNLPRPGKLEGYDPEAMAAGIMTRDAEYMESVYGDAMHAVSAGLRGLLIPDKGKKFVAGDYASIESVGLAGLAGCESKLDVFRRREDPYCAFASKALGFTVTKKTHPRERQEVGKPGELAFGFGGGVGAWRKFDDSDRFTDDQVKVFRDAWREAHPEIVELWDGLETAAKKALLDGRAEYNGVVYSKRGDFLVCTLPGGRNLSYFKPRLEEVEMPWSTPEKPATGLSITYLAWKSGQWKRVKTYGGKLAENITQAACRDVLVVGMFGAVGAGLPIVMHVHDEIVIEVLEKHDDASNILQQVMEEKQPWYSHWPVRVECWEGLRYRK
jgi:DNA polymerase bacteriophage-type